MASKRKRRTSPAPRGLAAGEQLKRSTLAGNDSSTWGWVGTEVLDSSQITPEHRMMSCGLSSRNKQPFCSNKYASIEKKRKSPREDSDIPMSPTVSNYELDNDVIVISDDEPPPCSKKLCKNNPNCLNYLGQDKWEDEDKARRSFLKLCNLGDDPILDSRDPDNPVGLKNLGATCYANAYLQVWFRDLAFRNGVYQCQPPPHSSSKFEESPIFQLQATFAALQEGVLSVFNPTKLVESLKLRTTEQQDAQEFSKLFMSHLDAEFQKQPIPSLKSLVADQFQGKQVYGTICDNCQNRSETSSDFLEIEVNFENNTKLEDRIAASLQPEKLSGDNQYLCSRCESLQDATRYTELRELPPVLHFSLLRFVYDFSSMERKKSKSTILFPTTLNMDKFLGSAASRKTASSDATSGENIYELRGVLLHKGASAYHGHYEAQVFDATMEAWYQFDDETVSKITQLGDKRSVSKVINVDADDDDESSKVRAKRPKKATKKMRVDSDDEGQDTEKRPVAGTSRKSPKETDSSQISSKDAYMLVYAKKWSPALPCNGSTEHEGPSALKVHGSRSQEVMKETCSPPSRVMEYISALNAAHDDACEKYLTKEKEAKLHFDSLRRRVMAIYNSWSVSNHNESSVVVSQQVLEAFLSRHLVKPAANKISPSAASSPRDDASLEMNITSDILCNHSLLDPSKASSMKRISQAAFERMKSETSFSIAPRLSPDEICEQCVNEGFDERLYQVQHPQFVAQLQEVDDIEEDAAGFWISKQWLRDWKLTKPRMHILGQNDPPPDAGDFSGHVKCEHRCLALNTTVRRRLSVEGYYLLKSLFPNWETLSTDAEVCIACDQLVHISKEDKREVRKRAEVEKAKLKYMHDSTLGSLSVDIGPCAIILAQFVRSWRRWLARPADAPRPEVLDNSSLLCSHDLLVFDPNIMGDINSSMVVVRRSDWDALTEFYPGGPLVALERHPDDSSQRYSHDIAVCVACRRDRKLNYETTEITIRILRRHDPDPTPSAYGELGQRIGPSSPVSKQQKLGATRQSTRIRQVKDKGGKRKLTISKSSTVKDIKMKLQEQLDIPTLYQRLFYRGHELEDNSISADALGVLADDMLDLREGQEGDITDSDSGPTKRTRREEGPGFGGTLLGSSQPPSSRNSVEATDMDVDDSAFDRIALPTKACNACTLANSVQAATCEVCDTPFD